MNDISDDKNFTPTTPFSNDLSTHARTSKRRILIMVVVVLILISGGLVLLSNEKSAEVIGDPVVQESVVTDSIYEELQRITPESKLFDATGTIVEKDTLRLFDIDDDGDEDIIGFYKINRSSLGLGTLRVLATWHQEGGKFKYYQDTFQNDFSFGPGETEASCSISDLSVGRIILTCTSRWGDYDVALRYNESGVGYYIEVDSWIVGFDANAELQEYTSPKAGVSFRHPRDISVTEKTYDLYGDEITIITGRRAEKILFEIRSLLNEGIPETVDFDERDPYVLLSLKDGTYLSRPLFVTGTNGLRYEQTLINQKTSQGNILHRSIAPIVNGKIYTFLTTGETRETLAEVDNIFASIVYVPPINVPGGSVATTYSELSFANSVTLSMPNVFKPIERDEGWMFGNRSQLLARQVYEVSIIDSPLYEPQFVVLELYPFISLNEESSLSSGGYDADNDRCFGTTLDAKPMVIGENIVCGFGGGDAGHGVEGYYVIDPRHRYILNVASPYEPSYPRDAIMPSLEDIVRSVSFSE